MTTLTAVSSTEVVVNNNGRILRVPVAKLIAVDESIASCVRAAVAYPGIEVNVPSKQPRGCTPRNSRVHGLLQ